MGAKGARGGDLLVRGLQREWVWAVFQEGRLVFCGKTSGLFQKIPGGFGGSGVVVNGKHRTPAVELCRKMSFSTKFDTILCKRFL